MTATVADVIAALEAAYPPALAADWDAVGLVCGDPAEPVSLGAGRGRPGAGDRRGGGRRRRAAAGHPPPAAAARRARRRRGHPEGRAAAPARSAAGTALFTAHTNADAADPGVSDALAAAHRAGRRAARWSPRAGRSRWTRSSRSSRSARRSPPCTTRCRRRAPGRIGDYSHCSFATAGTGQFKPLDRREPDDRRGRAAGAGGRDEAGDGAAARTAGPPSSPRCGPRTRTRSRRSTCSSSPSCPSTRGLGRIGTLPAPEPLAAFADAGAPPALPATAWGVRAAGRPGPADRSAVAVCGGAGDSALGAAVARRASTPTSPPTCATTRRRSTCSPARCGRATPALVDVAHWASEWPWCAQAADVVRAALGGSVEVRVSTPPHRPVDGGAERPGGQHMKADPAVQRRLLDLAEVDAELSRLAHRRRTLPEHAAADRGRGGRAHGQGQAGRGGDGGGRPGPRHPPPRARRRGRARPRRSGTTRCSRAPGSAPSRPPTCSTSWRRWPAGRRVLEDEQLEVMEQREAVGVDVEHSRGVLATAEQEVGDDRRAPRHRAGRHRRRRGRPAPRPATRSSRTCPADLLAAYEKRREQRRGRRGAAAAAALPGVPAGAGPHRARASCGPRRPTRSCTARSAA